MKKNYLWVVTIVSPYNGRTLLKCLDRQKLIDYLAQPCYAGFQVGEIKKSGRYYNTDGNTEISASINPIG